MLLNHSQFDTFLHCFNSFLLHVTFFETNRNSWISSSLNLNKQPAIIYVNASNIKRTSRRLQSELHWVCQYTSHVRLYTKLKYTVVRRQTQHHCISSNTPGRTYVSVLPSQPQPNTDPAEPLKSPTITMFETLFLCS